MEKHIPEGYKQTEVGVIPEYWVIYDANFLCVPKGIKIGPFGSQLKKEYLQKEGYKVYGQENVYQKDMTIGERHISFKRFSLLKTCEIKASDFLISMMGTIGKCMVVPSKFHQGIMDSHLIRLRLRKSIIYDKYFYYLFQSNKTFQQINQLSVGGIMDGLSSSIIKSLRFSIPSGIDEQIKTADALSDVDNLITSLEQLIEKKKAIKQGTMQELLTGRRRLEGFGEGKGYKQTELGMIPEDWSLNKLDYITSSIHSGTSITNNYLNGIFSIFGSTGEIGKCNNFDYSGERILVARVGANAGEVYRVNGNYSVSDNTLMMKVLITISFDYIYYYLHKLGLNSLIYGSGQPLITGSLLKQLKIRLPNSLKEQLAIAKVLSDMDSEIENLETKVDKYKQIKQGMMQNLLTGRIRLV